MTLVRGRLTIRQIETAEKVPHPLEKGGLSRILELESLLTSFQEREKLGKRDIFSALSDCDIEVRLLPLISAAANSTFQPSRSSEQAAFARQGGR